MNTLVFTEVARKSECKLLDKVWRFQIVSYVIEDTLSWDASPPELFSSFSCVAQGTRLRWRWPGTQFYLWYWMQWVPGNLPFWFELYQKAFKTLWTSGLRVRQVGLDNPKERHLVSHPSHDLLRMSIRMFITSILSKEGTEFPWTR